MSFNIMNNIDYRVGIYIRLSKEDEEKEKYSESESVQNQRTVLMQYIKENKFNFVAEYVDDGVSGTSFDRPAFNKIGNDDIAFDIGPKTIENIDNILKLTKTVFLNGQQVHLNMITFHMVQKKY